jgi:hypothetical protein
MNANIERNSIGDKEARTANSSYKKLAVQWLNEALCFVSSSLVADSFRLRNRQLLVAANRVCLESLRESGKNAVQKMEAL